MFQEVCGLSFSWLSVSRIHQLTSYKMAPRTEGEGRGCNFLVWGLMPRHELWTQCRTQSAACMMTTLNLSYKTLLSSWFSLKTQGELSKAPDINNGRRHNNRPLLSYHSLLTSSNKKSNVVNVRDPLISAVQLHTFFIIHFNFVGLLFSSSPLPSHCDRIYHVWFL